MFRTSIKEKRAAAMLLALVLLQANVAGPWAVTLAAPLGDEDFRIFIVQKGERLSGYMISERGQFDLEGRIEGNQVRLDWSLPDGGRLIPISFTGKVDRDFMSGSAKVGNLGESVMTAERRN